MDTQHSQTKKIYKVEEDQFVLCMVEEESEEEGQESEERKG